MLNPCYIDLGTIVPEIDELPREFLRLNLMEHYMCNMSIRSLHPKVPPYPHEKWQVMQNMAYGTHDVYRLESTPGTIRGFKLVCHLGAVEGVCKQLYVYYPRDVVEKLIEEAHAETKKFYERYWSAGNQSRPKGGKQVHTDKARRDAFFEYTEPLLKLPETELAAENRWRIEILRECTDLDATEAQIIQDAKPQSTKLSRRWC